MSLSITTYPTYKSAPKSAFAGKTGIVIDVLRASSTIVTALSNGAKDVITTEKIKDAKTIRAGGKIGEYICGGERGARKIPGFDYGNSPLEYTKETASNKHVVLCTTNGTQAIARAKLSETLLIGCLNNSSAVASAAATLKKPVVLLCSGTKQHFTCDDVVAAGAIVSCFLKIDPGATLDDLSYTAFYLYDQNKHNLPNFLEFTRPSKILKQLNAQHDIDYCLRQDILQNVPVLKNGRLVNL